jgi:hypothetical protein
MAVLRDTPAKGADVVEVPPGGAPVTEEVTPPRHQERFPFWRELVGGGLYAALVIAMTRMAAGPLSNTDTYFHLRFGQEFLAGWSLRHPGSVSTFATSSWLPTQWLPEVVMARAEQWLGLAAVAWLFGLMVLALVATLYLSARRWSGPLLSAGLTCLALLAASKGLSMRPQVLSFLLVTVTTTAWLRTRDDHRVRWWLVPLTWLWAMVHGMWPVGIAIGLVSVVAMAADRALPRQVLGRAVLVPVLSAAVAALTPVGPALYGAVLGVGSRSQYFSEWGSPDFTTVACLVLGLMLALTVVLMLRHRVQTWLDIALLIVAAGCAVWSWRTVPVAACMLVPLAAVQAHAGRARPAPPRRLERALVAGISVVALTGLAVVVPHTADKPPSQPAWVDPALSSLPAGTKVLDAWDWGGYLMWRYPQLDLLMHGYGDTFTVEELQRNTDITALAPGWDRDLRETGCTIAVLRPTALAYALEHQLHWTVLHRSEGIVELEAPADWTTSTV